MTATFTSQQYFIESDFTAFNILFVVISIYIISFSRGEEYEGYMGDNSRRNNIFLVVEAIIPYVTWIWFSGEGYICFALHAPDILLSEAQIFWYFFITSAAWDQLYFVQ